jgi:aspartyl-tRNA(Asn)/glutamyl-tRNA(Gln) amidotransferase subunit A
VSPVELTRACLVAEVREAKFPIPSELGRLVDAEAYAFHASHLARTPERYDPRTRDTILTGQGISQAETARLRQNLDQHRAALQDVFSSVDMVILPTLPGLPLTIQEATDPFALHACMFAFSLGGLPSISVPCGFSRSGLPIGLLLSDPPLSEPHIFAVAQAYEGATAWRQRRPFLQGAPMSKLNQSLEPTAGRCEVQT